MFVGIVVVVVGVGDVGIVVIVGIQVVVIQNQLCFFWQNEQEVDCVGVINMVCVGYDLCLMLNMFECLVWQYCYDGKLLEFFFIYLVIELCIVDICNCVEQYFQGGKEDSLCYQQMCVCIQLFFEEILGMVGKCFCVMFNDNFKLDVVCYGLVILQMCIGQFNDVCDNFR